MLFYCKRKGGTNLQFHVTKMFLKRKQQSRSTCWLAITGESMTYLGKEILRCQGTPNIPWIRWRMRCMGWSRDNWLFYRCGGHIEFSRFKEYCEMPREQSLSIYACFSGTKRTSMFISRERAIIFTSKDGTTIFFPQYNLFLEKLQEKFARKARLNTERVYRIVFMPPGHLIRLLESN